MAKTGVRKPGIRVLSLLLSLALLAAACARGGDPGDGGGKQPLNDHLLIAEVYPNGFAENGLDQFIRLHNPTGVPIDLGGWSVGDARVRAVFPAEARIGPRQSIYIARDTEGFRKVMGAPPDFAWGASQDGAPSLTGGSAFALGPEGGQLILRSASGEAVDTLVYGSAASLPGWTGAPVPAPARGEVIDRGRDEASWTELAPGLYTKDTDRAGDWKQGRTWVDQRVHRPGQTWFAYPTYAVDNLTLYATPDTTYETVTALLGRARRSIDLTLYDFSLVPVAEQLAAAARRGVRIRLLMEAGSAGRLDDGERYIAKVIAEAGGEVRWIVNDPGRGVYGRYVYNHAKYAVVDDRHVFVQSENMVRHGVPEDPSFGNRGWGVTVDDLGLAAFLARVFEADWSMAYGDVKEYEPGTPFGPPDPGYEPDRAVHTGQYRHPFPAVTVRGPVQVTPVLAPEHTLLDTKGVIGLMRSARKSLLIEQQYIQVYCHVCTTTPKTN